MKNTLPPEDDFSYWNEQERKWKSSLPKLTEKELYQEFLADNPELVENKLNELFCEQESLEKNIIQSINCSKLSAKTDTERLVLQGVIEQTAIRDLLALEKQIQRFKRYQQYRTPSAGTGNELDIEKARVYPITDLVSSLVALKRSGKNYFGRCPLHDDRSPSFFLYPDTNRFYCFGCKQGGDVIDLYQLLNGNTFREAVQYLTNS